MNYSTIINGLPVSATYSEKSINEIFIPFLQKLSQLQKKEGRRIIAFLAAPPGTGKSTLCSFLEELSHNTEGVLPICVIGMDGFHKKQEYLISHTAKINGNEVVLVDIKGNPITFDTEKLYNKLSEVRSGGTVLWPVYDRLLHDPIEDALKVEGNIVLIEGNYLLLDMDGWRELRQFADFSIYIKSNPDDLRKRLIDRKCASGTPAEKAAEFVEKSDLSNAVICNLHSHGADITLTMDSSGEYSLLV